MMRVAAFTGGRTVASARFRLRQYIPHLREHGIQVDEFTARFGSWPPRVHAARPFWLGATVAQRVPSVLRSHAYDLTFLQREMVSTLVTLERLTRAPRVFDVDDAIWLNGRGTHVARLVDLCEAVICGNSYIADHLRPMHANVLTLPTAVDTNRFRPAPPRARAVIGWSGMSSGLRWVHRIEPALRAVLERHPDAVLRILSDRAPDFCALPADRVEYVRWSEEVEVRTIQEMSVGLMPLGDSPFARGKCSYKMLLYMACGVPVVVSPVGMNTDVLALGGAGFSAVSQEEWVESISALLREPDTAADLGSEARRTVERHFSVDVLAPRLASFLGEAAARKSRGSG